jgi:hypothetical protein
MHCLFAWPAIHNALTNPTNNAIQTALTIAAPFASPLFRMAFAILTTLFFLFVIFVFI